MMAEYLTPLGLFRISSPHRRGAPVDVTHAPTGLRAAVLWRDGVRSARALMAEVEAELGEAHRTHLAQRTAPGEQAFRAYAAAMDARLPGQRWGQV